MLRSFVVLIAAFLVSTGYGIFSPQVDTHIPLVVNGQDEEGTPTATSTSAPTSTATPTAIPQSTATPPVPTPEGTATATATNPPTNTPAPTNTPTATPSPTTAPTHTPSPTNIPTVPTPTASASPTPTATKQLQTLPNWSYRLLSSGELEVVGEVYNHGPTNLGFFLVRAELLDAAGNILATGDGLVAGKVIQPNSASCFWVTFQNPPPREAVKWIEFHSTSGGVVPALNPGLVLYMNPGEYAPDFSYFLESGQVHNDSAEVFNHVSVAVTLYSAPNGGGKVIRCASNHLNPRHLLADQVGSYDLQFFDLFAGEVRSSHTEVDADPPITASAAHTEIHMTDKLPWIQEQP